MTVKKKIAKKSKSATKAKSSTKPSVKNASVPGAASGAQAASGSSKKIKVKIREINGELVFDESIGTEVEVSAGLMLGVGMANTAWEISQNELRKALESANH